MLPPLLNKRLTATAFALALTLPAAAHHGRDFLLVQDAAVPLPFTGILYSNFVLATHPGPDEWTIEPGIQYGIAPGLSLGATLTFLDEGEGMEYAALSPQLQWQLNPGTKGPIRLSLLAGYQFAESTGDAHDHGDHDHGTGTACGPEFGPDAPPCETIPPHTHAHSHSGIHQHGTDALFTRFILEADIAPDTKLALNLIGVLPDGDNMQWGYAAGLRHAFSHAFALGIEALGDFKTHGYHEIAAAAYFSPTHTLTLKCGLGTGLTSQSPDLTLHTGLLWRF